jgi:hypothetical protein
MSRYTPGPQSLKPHPHNRTLKHPAIVDPPPPPHPTPSNNTQRLINHSYPNPNNTHLMPYQLQDSSPVHPESGRHFLTHYSPILNINPPMHKYILRAPMSGNSPRTQIAQLYQTVAYTPHCKEGPVRIQ